MGISIYWNVFFIAALSQAIFVLLILYGKYYKDKNISQLILGFFITSFSYILLNNMVYWNQLIGTYPHFLFSVISIRFLLAPLFYLYCLSFIRVKFDIKIRDLWHFLPFVIILLYYLPIILLSGEEKLAIIQPPYFKKYLHYYYAGRTLEWLFSLQLISYPIYLFFLLGKANKTTSSNFVERKSVQKKWLLFLTGLFLLYGLLMLLYQILVTYELGGIEKDFIISAVMCFAIYSISYVGMMNSILLEGSQFLDNISILKYSNSTLTEKEAKKIIKQLEQLMQEQSIYLESDLNLDKVSVALNISRHQISQSLNMMHHKSFYNFVNEYRVNHAKVLLQSEKKENNIKTVLYASGFNNRASFNNNFKKITGMTATEFIKQKGGG